MKPLIMLAVGAACLFCSVSAWASVPTKRVLILFPYENNFPGFFYFDTTLRSHLKASPSFFFDFYAESMDLLRFPRERYFEELLNLYREKYAGRNIDLIIATLGPTRDFLARYKEELFPGTPVLCVDIDTRLLDDCGLNNQGAAVTGRFDFEGTLELALGLHPDVRDVFVVSGASQVDRELESLARESFQRFGNKIRFHHLSGLPMDELLIKVSELPKPSVIFYLAYYLDAHGRTFLSPQAASMIAEKSSVPVYGISEYYIGAGIVGGRLYSFPELGEKTAQSALRLLSGEAAGQIERQEVKADRVVVDWRQVERWGISEGSLPPGSIVRNREFSAWETYRLQILGTGTFLVLQTGLVAALLYNLKRRKQAYRALSRSEEKLKQAASEWHSTFDSIPDRIMVLDLNFRIVRVNQAAADFHGLAPERMLGCHCCTLVCGTDKPSGDCPMGRMLATRRHEEQEFYSKEKGAWLLVSVDPVLDAAGNVAEIIHTTRDITRRRMAEAEAHRRMTELAHVTRVATMGELAASLAHEINQPLTAILANAQAARRFLSMTEPDLDEVRQILDDIVSDDRRVSEVIRRMRALLKKQAVFYEEFDVNEAVMDCVALANSAPLIDGLTIATGTNAGPILVRADRVQLQQVIFNLMVNAAGAMTSTPRGSRKILITAATDDGRTARISVSDSGTGIDEHNVDRLFEPFYTTKPEGMGMGLAISRTIVRAHGGELGAANNAGVGATFTFTLPVCRTGGPDVRKEDGQVGQ